MSNEKMREEFEAWALARFINSETMNPLLRDPEESDEYLYTMVNMAWVAWQASRAALVIELPEDYCYDSSGEAYLVIRDCREAIEAAGLKVKP